MARTIDFPRHMWRAPERLSLGDWAAKHYYLSAESSAEEGRWRPYPYQPGIMNAVTDPRVERITWQKSARVGATKIINAIVGYYMHQDPCPILVVQPTVEDAEGYSKEEIAPMLRDCPALASIFAMSGGGKAKTTSDTISHKVYPGGSISMIGANSGRGFRRVSRKVVLFDEVDGYPASAGADGDQITLGVRRTEHYWDRKIFLASTPLVAGASRIVASFEEGDQRHFYVPCPHCQHMARIVFFRSDLDKHHYFTWPEGEPEKAHLVCQECGTSIDHRHKFDMLSRGEWRASAPFNGHASFHIWAGYSLSPNASWGQIAREYAAAQKAGDLMLKAFYNTVLGEVWIEKGDAPEWEILKSRRGEYEIGHVPRGVHFLTCGVDVQKDCLYYEVVGWGDDAESWSIEAGILHGETAKPEVWSMLDELLTRPFNGDDGPKRIARMCVDAGNWGQTVYSWCRRYSMHHVNAVRGIGRQPTILSAASKVDVNFRGKKIGYKFYNVGVDVIKGEWYSFLRVEEPGQRGFCHYPAEADDEWFKQITAEHMVDEQTNTGHVKKVWKVLAGRENHWLDCRVYARAAAALAGMDRAGRRARTGAKAQKTSTPAPAPASVESSATVNPPQSPRRRRQRQRTGWLAR